MDRYLGEAGSGPTWLQREDIAQLVLRSIQYAGDPLRFYNLHAWVIMSNHVHFLVAPRVVPARFLQLVKGYTAREANRLLRCTGERFLARRRVLTPARMPAWQAKSPRHKGAVKGLSWLDISNVRGSVLRILWRAYLK
jgi:hypothetical protein